MSDETGCCDQWEHMPTIVRASREFDAVYAMQCTGSISQEQASELRARIRVATLGFERPAPLKL